VRAKSAKATLWEKQKVESRKQKAEIGRTKTEMLKCSGLRPTSAFIGFRRDESARQGKLKSGNGNRFT
jgi:hypothetical protein